MIEMMEKLNRKVNSLATTSSLAFQGRASTFTNAFSKEMKQCYYKMKEWKSVKDIVELVQSLDCLSLNPMMWDGDLDLFAECGAIIRCEVCFTLHKDKARKLTPARPAKALPKDCSSICTGKFISPEIMEEMISGNDENWRKLKSRTLQHMECASDGQVRCYRHFNIRHFIFSAYSTISNHPSTGLEAVS